MIGITFGAFDPLHFGHIRLFKNAKKICDTLIVCVSDEAYIKKIKKRKPLISLSGRLEVINELKCIDGVDIQTIEGKKPLIDKYKPDRIFVGDDWTPQTFSGERLGVKVIYLPYTKGITSTKIREGTSYKTWRKLI